MEFCCICFPPCKKPPLYLRLQTIKNLIKYYSSIPLYIVRSLTEVGSKMPWLLLCRSPIHSTDSEERLCRKLDINGLCDCTTERRETWSINCHHCFPTLFFFPSLHLSATTTRNNRLHLHNEQKMKVSNGNSRQEPNACPHQQPQPTQEYERATMHSEPTKASQEQQQPQEQLQTQRQEKVRFSLSCIHSTHSISTSAMTSPIA